jgi:TonB family protein
MNIERERACDDNVLIGLGGSAPDYADHLVQIARRLNGRFGLLASSMAHPSQLKLRVVAILDSRMRRTQMTRLAMAGLLCATTVATLGLSSIQVARLSAMPLPAILPPLHPSSSTVERPAAIAKPVQTVGQEPGFVVNREPISYPRDARQKGIEGRVVVELNFNANGEIVDARILSGPEELRQAALQTALQSTYGIRTARSLQVMVDFKLPPAGTGELSGAVKDGLGASIPGVTVTATNIETQIDVVSVSNESGEYRFLGLRPGTYRLNAGLSGFQDRSYNNVRLGDSQQVRMNFMLQAVGPGGSQTWSIPSTSPISLPDQFPSGVVQNLVLTGLQQPAFAEVSEKLQNVKGQRITTELLTQVRSAIKETSWGDQPASFVISSGTDNTADLLIKLSARAEKVDLEIVATPALDRSQQSPSLVRATNINQTGMNLVQQVQPVYPKIAKDAKIQGVVVLEVSVAANGTVSGAKVITGHPLLVPPALDAVRQWVYKPTLVAGQPVEAVSNVTFNFALQQ